MRIGYILLGIALHVAISSTPSVVEAESVQITEGSIPYQNAEMVIQFLRDHGDDTVADEIQTLLSKGKLYVDSDLAENAETSALNNITLSSTMAAHTLPFNRDRPFDPVKDFQSILELARTLYHENIHANHQSYAYWLYSMPAPGEPRESDAWSKTISAMDGWLHVEQERFYCWSWKLRISSSVNVLLVLPPEIVTFAIPVKSVPSIAVPLYDKLTVMSLTGV